MKLERNLRDQYHFQLVKKNVKTRPVINIKQEPIYIRKWELQSEQLIGVEVFTSYPLYLYHYQR